MDDDRRAAAIVAIEAAWAGIERPADAELLHPRAFDDNDLRSLYGGTTWRDLADAPADRPPDDAAPSFLSAVGYRYFLAGYLVWILRHPDSPYAVVDSTIWGLTPPGNELHEFVVSKYALVDEPQRQAIVGALEAFEALTRHPDVGPALTYWRRAARAARAPRTPETTNDLATDADGVA